ncbi:hypothetical protein [Azospirillum endophyticum]
MSPKCGRMRGRFADALRDRSSTGRPPPAGIPAGAAFKR